MRVRPVRAQRPQQQPRHYALPLVQRRQGADDRHQRVRARVEQVLIAEDAQRRVVRASRPQRHPPGLLAVAQAQGVVLLPHFGDAGLRVAHRDLAAHHLSVDAPGHQCDPVGSHRCHLQRERLGHGDRPEQVLDAEQRALTCARRRDRQQHRRPSSPSLPEQGARHFHLPSSSRLMPCFPGRHSTTSFSSAVASMRMGIRLPRANSSPSPRGTRDAASGRARPAGRTHRTPSLSPRRPAGEAA